jgi:uncharacterized protein YjbI with pentapeptide repeats
MAVGTLFTGANLSAANARSGIFSNADFRGVDARFGDWTGSVLGSADLRTADFSRSDLTDVDHPNLKGSGAVLLEATLSVP